MNDDNKKIDPNVIASAIQMIENSLSRNNDNRSKNRNLAIVVAGAVIGIAFKEQSFTNVLMMGCVAVAVALLFWYQDYQFHKWRHGWDGMRKRIRQYISDEIDESELAILTYFKEDEKRARFFSKSSSFTFVVLAVGAVLVILFKYITVFLQQKV